MEFREEFSHLRSCLFQIAEKQSTEPIPILFMTATASLRMVNDLERLTGLTFKPQDDMLWPRCHSGVHRRNIFLGLSFKDSPIRRIKADLTKLCRASGGRKLIVYSNSQKAINNFYHQSRTALNVLGIQKDVLLVHGNMFREQKFHHTDMFIGQPLLDECPTTRLILCFDPVAYFATAATSSSGLDCAEVDKVIFHGFPSSIEDLLQCSGRCGRGPTASPSNSSFYMVVSLNSLIALMTRIFIIPKYEAARAKDNKPDSPDPSTMTSTQQPMPSTTLNTTELAARQWQNVLPVLSLVCLNTGRCIHHQLEELMLHPDSSKISNLPQSCGNACWRCSTSGLSTPMDCAINKANFKSYLIAMFITHKLVPSKLALHRDCFLNEMMDFTVIGADEKPLAPFDIPFHKRVFGVKSQKTAKPRAKALLLKCFAAGILEPEVDGFTLRVKLGYDRNGNPLMNDDAVWNGFKCKTDNK